MGSHTLEGKSTSRFCFSRWDDREGATLVLYHSRGRNELESRQAGSGGRGEEADDERDR